MAGKNTRRRTNRSSSKRNASKRKTTRNRRKKRNNRTQLYAKIGLLILLILTVVLLVRSCVVKSGKYWEDNSADVDASKPEIDVQLLDVNEYSRPGIKSGRIKGIVIHYTANPGASAQNNRDYFEGLKDSHITKASSHFVVGLEGEVIQCIPVNEIAYANAPLNNTTVAIEVCHPDDSGKFNDATYESLVDLTAFLCRQLKLTPGDVIRHYDVNEKLCPKYYVEHEDAWEQFLKDVKAAMKTESAG